MVEWIVTYFCGINVRNGPNLSNEKIDKIEKGTIIIELNKIINKNGQWIKHNSGWSLLQDYRGIKYMFLKKTIDNMKRCNKCNNDINKIMGQMDNFKI